MNLLEADVEKFQRRIDRMDRNPDPSRLQSTRLLYQIWLDVRRKQYKDWKERTKPFVWHGLDAPRLFIALGVHGIKLTTIADGLHSEHRRYLPLARRYGYPESVCDRTQAAVGLGLSGDLPEPAFMVADSCCDPRMHSVLLLSREMSIPMFVVDSPRSKTYEAVTYLAEQLRGLIRFAETNFGVTFDERKLRELQQRDQEIDALMEEGLQLRKVKPCPLSGADALRAAPVTLDHPLLVEFQRALIGELKERVARGASPYAEEKMRVYWLLANPTVDDLYSIVERRGVAVPLMETAAGVGIERQIGDDAQYGRHLSPLEEEAACLLSSTTGGWGEWRVQEIVSRAKEFGIDALVHYQLSGCTLALASGRIVADRAKKELGIPSLMLDGYFHDEEKYSRQRVEIALNDFLDTCFAEKGLR